MRAEIQASGAQRPLVRERESESEREGGEGERESETCCLATKRIARCDETCDGGGVRDCTGVEMRGSQQRRLNLGSEILI
eukprot:6211861-Pleurochrysis_carterae.AAC.2